MAVAESEKQYQRLRSHLTPYRTTSSILNGKKVAIDSVELGGHSTKPPYVNRLLLSQSLFFALGEHVIGHPTFFKEICDRPEESPYGHHLLRGRLFRFIKDGIFEFLPDSIRPKPDHEFWRTYIDSLVVSVLILNNPRENHLSRRLQADGLTITYFFRERKMNFSKRS